MALITAVNKDVGIQNTATSFTSASLTPVANKLYIISVLSFLGSGTPNDCTLSGGGMTWTWIGTQLSTDNHGRLTMFRALSSSPGSPATVTSANGGQTVSWNWSIEEFSNVATTGSNGADAVVQFAGTPGPSTTGLTVTLSAFGNANNAPYGYVFNSTGPGITVGSGFTQLSQQSSQSCAEWKNSNDTTVDWTWSSASQTQVAIAIEIKDEVIVNISGASPFTTPRGFIKF